MHVTSKTLPRLVFAAIASLILLSGCSETSQSLEPVAEEGGCSPQVPVSRYRTQAGPPMGTLVISVLDANGKPLPGANVEAVWMVYTGTRCRSAVQGTSDSEGIVRFERLKPGPYTLYLVETDQASTSTEIKDGETTTITLTPAS